MNKQQFIATESAYNQVKINAENLVILNLIYTFLHIWHYHKNYFEQLYIHYCRIAAQQQTYYLFAAFSTFSLFFSPLPSKIYILIVNRFLF